MGGFHITQKINSLNAIVTPLSIVPLTRPVTPGLEHTHQLPIRNMNNPLADDNLSLQTVAGYRLATAKYLTSDQNIKPFLPLASETPHDVKKDPANCPVSYAAKDPRLYNRRLSMGGPSWPYSNERKDPRLSQRRLSIGQPKDRRTITWNKKKGGRLYNDLKISGPSWEEREKARRVEEQNKLFASRKLSLVLDLDHTLVHSVVFDAIAPTHDATLKKMVENESKNPKKLLFRLANIGVWTKLRPGIWNFLERASKLFELHVNTMGSKLYATEVVKLLDPSGALFAGRVTSSTGELDRNAAMIPKTKNLNNVLGLESTALIIDDTPAVWPANQQNLVRAEMYNYFPSSGKISVGVVGNSLFETNRDESSGYGILSSLLQVIERVHQSFFSAPCLSEADVRSILVEEQHKVLHGFRVCFSGINLMEESNKQLHPLWRLAEQFGASCTSQIDENVTHVVAYSLDSNKVMWAVSRGKYVVHPKWLEASAFLYRKACEQQFGLN